VKIRVEDKAMNGGSYHTITKFPAYLDNGKMQLWAWFCKKHEKQKTTDPLFPFF
jgi:hypothetical protein